MIINNSPFLNAHNNGWIYLCQDDAGLLWVRSTGGKWAQIEPPASTEDLAADFEKSSSQSASLEDIKTDNVSDNVVKPSKGKELKPEAPAEII